MALDPEILLFVEAVRGEKLVEWHHAFARMTSRGCEVHRGDKLIWTVPRVSREPSTASYFNVVQRYAGPGAD